ncbi:hypothetical protein HYFRA_00006143 [Hymenoscyphus fraxineus]|uniref:Berberine/berberine-like domain-containing protein n=1 Tax=Hymenoscyphus fraxineus TaxID=746836 RepID=A0A9N9LCC9_9HELO|nr:hypothetical protein HYFRA_00006143 [Hymenoscyphus fraxineus]
MQLPDEESAYSYRDVKMHLQLETEYDDTGRDQNVDTILQSAREKVNKGAGYDGEQTVYVNFAHGDDGPAAWYGKRKLEKLGRIESEWDPNGLFSFYNHVPAINHSYASRR